MDADYQRRIEALAPRIRLGEVKGFRFRPFTSRLRGKDASMGFSRKGRVADYSPVMSHIAREAVFRNKEVSPRFDLVLVLALTGERAFDARILEVADCWGYLVTRCLGGGIAILAEQGGRFTYSPPIRDWHAATRRSAELNVAAVNAKVEPIITKLRAFSGAVGAFYDGAHLVVIGPYWEHEAAQAYARGQPYGTTFCMVETPNLAGSGFFGDVLPHTVIEQRIQERRKRLIEACKKLRANTLIFSGKENVVDCFTTGLAGSRIL